MQASPTFSFVFEGNVTFNSVAGSTAVDQTIPVARLHPDNFTLLIMPNLQDGLIFCNVQCSALNTLKVRFMNETAGALTPDGTAIKLVQF